MTQPSREARELEAADRLIDQASAQIRDSQADPQVVEQAAQRVWQQLQRRGLRIVPPPASALVDSDDDADEDHGRVVRLADRRPRRFGFFADSRWALAATFVLGLGAAFLAWRVLAPAQPSASVKTVDGQLFQVLDSAHRPLAAGAAVLEGDHLRTGRDGGALVLLNDGSRIEMRERSEIALEETSNGTIIHLERGNVIVEAAEQRLRRLHVSTRDCEVVVKGTIFSVNNGTKGTRVAVIEGEVQVDHSGKKSILLPGEQVTTGALLDNVTVEQEISWSRGVDGYLELLREYRALRQEIEERVPHANLRYSSRLLDLMPADTIFYGAIPNLPEKLSETNKVMRERIEQSPVLADWWRSQANGLQEELDHALTFFGELGGYLGQELAFGVAFDPNQDEDNVSLTFLAEIKNGTELRAMIERHVEAFSGHDADLVFVNDPNRIKAAPGNALYLWLTGDLAVGTSDLEHLRRVAAALESETNSFRDSDFYSQVQALYGEGADILIAGDLQRLLDSTRQSGDSDAQAQTMLEIVGLANARYLMLEQKKIDAFTQHRAALTFADQRQGVLSWLDAPAPMGALEMISPDAKFVVAAVLKDPVKLFDDLGRFVGPDLAKVFSDFETRYGISVRDDFAATIGGEIAVAIDGPLLPKPSWKIILEVYDPARFELSLEQAVAEANRLLAERADAPKVKLAIETREKGGRTHFTLKTDVMDLHYTFVDGYLVMTPDAALIDRALRVKSSGFSILTAPRFTDLLPADGRVNVSALIYQDLGSLIGVLGEKLSKSELTPDQKNALEAFSSEAKPSLGYAYGEADRIIFATSSEGDALSGLMLRLLGMKDPAGLDTILEQLFKS